MWGVHSINEVLYRGFSWPAMRERKNPLLTHVTKARQGQIDVAKAYSNGNLANLHERLLLFQMTCTRMSHRANSMPPRPCLLITPGCKRHTYQSQHRMSKFPM